MNPRFEDIVDEELSPGERERLERVHDLLIAAGPPAELPPHLERGPTLGMTLARKRRSGQRRLMLLAAAIAVLAVVFVAGFAVGNSGNGIVGTHSLQLVGTKQASGALASLVIQNADESGNWPMTLSATGLPKLPTHGYYEVYLWRQGKAVAPCGVFVVSNKSGAVSVHLNAPYHIRKGDSWVVTKQLPGMNGAGPVVLHPQV
ncbi:MAG TPA: hypothetical protein VHQ89_11265 [Gaiellaceae bacterium]|jgi:hypothetical protein|nr:hypothetical protein [Gaiellaceae bacterium]